LNWCIKPQQWLKANPLAEVTGTGRRRHGKPQLRIDEARRLRLVCHEKARDGDDGAVAVLVGLLMGLRAQEIVTRTVRDLDDGGRILWVDANDQVKFSPKRNTRRLCRLAQVPEVCAHSLRGFAATLGLLSGVPLAQVAAALGHESGTTTLQSRPRHPRHPGQPAGPRDPRPVAPRKTGVMTPRIVVQSLFTGQSGQIKNPADDCVTDGASCGAEGSRTPGL